MQLEPWPHTVVDSTFNADLFAAMRAELIEYTKKQPLFVGKSTQFNDLSDLPATRECLDSVDFHAMLDDFPVVRQRTNLKKRYQVMVCHGEYEHKIHDEVPRKVLSAVTYVASNKGTGTRLYDESRNFVSEVTWQENRTLIFAGITNKTWHDFYSKEGSVRITVNVFLESDDLR